ncbi:DUF177 domain-containing protein [Chloroflexota bacterium]
MWINVAQFLQSPVGTTRRVDLDEALDIFGNGEENAVKGVITLLRTPCAVLVQADLTAGVPVTCSRCLAVFQSPTGIEIEEEFLPTVSPETGAALPQDDDPAVFTINSRHEIDLTEAIRQYVVMALPLKALCREDCAGMCPKCGQDLNQSRCECDKIPAAPLWRALQEK